jgi:hypothetical protein
VGVQGFPAGNAVNTYASDCQGTASANILPGSLGITTGPATARSVT